MQLQLTFEPFSPQRCPFCHEAIDHEADRWLACEECLARHHHDCWQEGAGCATCRSGVALTAEAPLPETVAQAQSGSLEQQADRLEGPPAPSRTRTALTVLLITLVAFTALIHLLRGFQLEQTAALFVGVPALLACLLALTPRPKSITGLMIKGITLALLVSGVFLGEGMICVLMAAPLFYAVAIPIGIVLDKTRARERKRPTAKALGLVLLVVLPFSLEGTHPALSFARQEEVSVSRTIPRPVAEIELALAESPAVGAALPVFLQLGFPVPTEVEGAGLALGDRRRVHFAGGEGEGDLVLEVTGREPGRVQFRFVSDTSPIAHWLTWETASVTMRQVGTGRTRVTWSVRYRRDLDPAWYFAPVERYGVSCALEVLLDSLDRSPPPAKTREVPTLVLAGRPQ